MKVYRQGDVSIINIDRIPKKIEPRQDLILAKGEVTGHAHRITEGQAILYTFEAILYLRVLSEFAKLYHEEHEEILLPKGDYEIKRQKEVDWLSESVRNVTD